MVLQVRIEHRIYFLKHALSISIGALNIIIMMPKLINISLFLIKLIFLILEWLWIAIIIVLAASINFICLAKLWFIVIGVNYLFDAYILHGVVVFAGQKGYQIFFFEFKLLLVLFKFSFP